MKTTIEQYKALRAKHPDCILLFRKGIRYFAFNAHAKILAEICGAETAKQGRITTASISEFELKEVLPKLATNGRRIAICEPLTTPKH